MTDARVEATARLHFGFQNLSLAHQRLYGGIGVALDRPAFVVTAERAEEVSVRDDADGPDATAVASEHARRAVDLLGVPGVAVTVRERFPRHVGLGSGTQFALAVYAAVAAAHDRPVDVRAAAPKLGRGGRSGVGVAGFERGGFVVDGGHPTSQFTTDRPADGEWTVPPVTARHDLPDDWRFVLVLPDADPGRSGDDEDSSMRSVVEDADPALADEISAVLTRRLLPAAAAGRREAFGAAVAEIGRLNGAWYTDAQGGVFRPPVGRIVEELGEHPVVSGVGQSSWGPIVYGLTDRDSVGQAKAAARDALDAASVDGRVLAAGVRNEGAVTER
ncbi:beta-ribofuranosylaminobenzene 5'-phosphate synthase [Natronoarchaeum philippinense]|uniref:Beta-ribofuranosylaminobenzene 5'-phosphate synthase n=1 Tax=Natronoarchaeum philippinense TaxID=558529 RepID=A0A285P8L1_NATPI|nr:beta-ribofuranosylaminobenzene 5'-phosphate synthase family protein [Natronoarchaeum philippinense]SNZ18052.1 beta-ribofuranosylaminobenzene 5'-phosphate synthase [Natronoarchaeum philippinense]